ncbi:MAG: hypothetical protein CMH49_06765 [Myxococcales bacterium]|nr:hypothetical protein [Myxococcales bacterium]
MSINQDEALALLKQKSLRATAPRLAVLQTLSESKKPLSYSEMLEKLQGRPWDPTTIYRNLIKLSEHQLITVVSRAEGMSRYALNIEHGDQHNHPHFICDDCGQVSCVPAELNILLSDPAQAGWVKSIASAVVQLRGECPDCLVP